MSDQEDETKSEVTSVLSSHSEKVDTIEKIIFLSFYDSCKIPNRRKTESTNIYFYTHLLNLSVFLLGVLPSFITV